MGTIYRFVEEPAASSEVTAWFRALPQPPSEVPTERATVLYFRAHGSLVYGTNGEVDARKSPIATVFLPRAVRNSLWTVGEVHFLGTLLRRRFPRLHKISSDFSRWLADHPCIYSGTSASNAYDYYLEGSVKNYDQPIYAFPSALAALRAGRYFVSDGDNDVVLDKLCRALNLRGVECTRA